MGSIAKLMYISLVFNGCRIGGSGVPKIGIVGGGIAGSSVAYFLQQLFGENNLTVDIFECNKIGGRLSTEKLQGNYYEMGGAVIHPRNKYMVELVKLFDLKRRVGGEPSAFGLYDGKNIVFSESNESWEFWNAIKLLWRYGLDTFKLKNFIDDMLDHFSRIYDLQDEGKSFESVDELLSAMNRNFANYLRVSSKVGFKESGFLERVINELILATLLVNYGQTTDVHKFVGAVSVAGGTPGLWAIEGGNHLVVDRLLKAANASIIKGQVLNVTLISGTEKFLVSYTSHSHNVESKIYDIFIVASPIANNIKPNLKFLNFPGAFSFPGNYHQTVCTILKGDINSKFFEFNQYQIQEILSINSSLFFNSIGKIYPVNSKKTSFAWKIFSQVPLKSEDLQKLFFNIEEVKQVSWLAYPHYDTSHYSRNFVLHKNLYHINAIEWAASAMEMSLIGAKNVALLAYKNWFNQTVNSPTKPLKEKREL